MADNSSSDDDIPLGQLPNKKKALSANNNNKSTAPANKKKASSANNKSSAPANKKKASSATTKKKEKTTSNYTEASNSDGDDDYKETGDPEDDDDDDYDDDFDSSPVKKKSKKRANNKKKSSTDASSTRENSTSTITAGKMTVCNFLRGATVTCNNLAHPTGADPTKCQDHQQCLKCNRVIGKGRGKIHEYCKACTKEDNANKEEEMNKEMVEGHEFTENMSETKLTEFRLYKEAVNKNLPPGEDKKNTEEAAKHLVHQVLPGVKQILVQSSSTKKPIKQRQSINLKGATVYVTDGNHENKFGTPRLIKKQHFQGVDGNNGNNDVEVDGIKTRLNSKKFVVLRNKKGMEIEEEFKAMKKSKRDLIFVDSFSDVDESVLKEKTSCVQHWHTVPVYVARDGKVEVECDRSIRFYLGMMTKSEKERIQPEAINWLDSEDFHKWAKEYALKKPGEEVSESEISHQMIHLGVSFIYQCVPIFISFIALTNTCIICNSIKLMVRESPKNVDLTESQQEKEALRLQQKFPKAAAGEKFDPKSTDLSHLFDDSTIKGMDIDSIGNLPDNERPHLVHVACHTPRHRVGGRVTTFTSQDGIEHKNENYLFDKDEYLDRINASNNYGYLAANYGPHLVALGYGTDNQSALNNFLDERQGEMSVMGADYLRDRVFVQNQENAPGAPLDYSPHVTQRKSENTRAYVSASLRKALHRFRRKEGWEQHYGWNRPHGKRCTVIVIDSKFWPLIGRVGCVSGNGNQNDLGSTLLPLPILAIYEVTWTGVRLDDSIWRKIYDNGNWIPYANTQVTSLNNAANASMLQL